MGTNLSACERCFQTELIEMIRPLWAASCPGLGFWTEWKGESELSTSLHLWKPPGCGCEVTNCHTLLTKTYGSLTPWARTGSFLKLSQSQEVMWRIREEQRWVCRSALWFPSWHLLSGRHGLVPGCWLWGLALPPPTGGGGLYFLALDTEAGPH